MYFRPEKVEEKKRNLKNKHLALLELLKGGDTLPKDKAAKELGFADGYKGNSFRGFLSASKYRGMVGYLDGDHVKMTDSWLGRHVTEKDIDRAVQERFKKTLPLGRGGAPEGQCHRLLELLKGGDTLLKDDAAKKLGYPGWGKGKGERERGFAKLLYRCKKLGMVCYPHKSTVKMTDLWLGLKNN